LNNLSDPTIQDGNQTIVVYQLAGLNTSHIENGSLNFVKLSQAMFSASVQTRAAYHDFEQKDFKKDIEALNMKTVNSLSELKKLNLSETKMILFKMTEHSKYDSNVAAANSYLKSKINRLASVIVGTESATGHLVNFAETSLKATAIATTTKYLTSEALTGILIMISLIFMLIFAYLQLFYLQTPITFVEKEKEGEKPMDFGKIEK
jgi:hypothetical protein